MKKTLILIIAIVLVGIGLTYYFLKNDKSGTYEIHVELVDDRSPDRILKVFKNGKETNDYKHIKYDDKKNIILCYQENPAVNVFELDKDEMIVVLNSGEEVIAKLIRKDKEK